ncbi:hypothetical protein KAFR_0I01340 [Kazachstania africana CBS 2517]|uniref:Plasmodium RESA N-terminal domain-containing protein n=1 Tax=Kazachstania africana (strain ATCC 22294 / BCRC 22015 / CBS 2517 / CECT 1963 / NBRC 1671 / NRRL Y-8276) TaxID=1071382 RepID=H2AZW5_KAZAF|nr:hypothetical protein KAFR_0I01340 [Kazachstania africana CBS 2517]CCF59915.1 hypothetical protein KAFR_0I01340 [Kazachstania africana CBS 2517]
MSNSSEGSWSYVEVNNYNSERSDDDMDVADVLSNTSSESSPHNYKNDDDDDDDDDGDDEFNTLSHPSVPTNNIDTSFDTLTGSKIGKSKNLVIPKVEDLSFFANSGNNDILNGKISKNKFKNLHLIVLTSLVSVILTIGFEKSLQMYRDQYYHTTTTDTENNGIVKGPTDDLSVSWLIETQQTYLKVKLNDDDDNNAALLTDPGPNNWVPKGKYYVDFDNRIIVPINEDEFNIFQSTKLYWYTILSNVKKKYHEDYYRSIRRANDSYRKLVKMSTYYSKAIKGMVIRNCSNQSKRLKQLSKSFKSVFIRKYRLLHSEYQNFIRGINSRYIRAKSVYRNKKLKDSIMKKYHQHCRVCKSNRKANIRKQVN